jgi:formate hydrogenlyase subunit 3/multisubunit Na+/H+ antiporter MnhD subunit
MVLALTGASTLSRFLPVPLKPSGAPLDLGAPLFRRHPVAGIAGLIGLFSLAGVPGTPGSLLWLDVARALAATHRTTLLLVMMAAWLAALAVALRQMREAVGTPSPDLPVRAVPRGARLALWATALGTIALAVVAWSPR